MQNILKKEVLKSELIEVKVENFYQTCSISRSSENMANCVREILEIKRRI